MPQPENPGDRSDAADAVSAREGSDEPQQVQGRAVRGRRASAQVAHAAPRRPAQVTLVERLGLALIRPRAALALAGDRMHAGRSGSDLLVAMVVLVLATQLRVL